jgi:hypothetical protein
MQEKLAFTSGDDNGEVQNNFVRLLSGRKPMILKTYG